MWNAYPYPSFSLCSCRTTCHSNERMWFYLDLRVVITSPDYIIYYIWDHWIGKISIKLHVFSFFSQINQLRTPLNWSDVPLIRTATSAPGPAFTPPTLLSTAPRPPTLWSTASALTPPTRPLISFLTSNAAQVAGAGHPPIGRLVHNYTVPPVNATGPPGFSVTESENEWVHHESNEKVVLWWNTWAIHLDRYLCVSTWHFMCHIYREIHNLLNEHVLEEQREALPSRWARLQHVANVHTYMPSTVSQPCPPQPHSPGRETEWLQSGQQSASTRISGAGSSIVHTKTGEQGF